MLPTDAHMTCKWGEVGGEPFPVNELINFTLIDDVSAAPDRLYLVKYEFGNHGEYNVSCEMYNKVSSQWETPANLMVVFNRILNFTVRPGFLLKGVDPLVGELTLPMGSEGNQLPTTSNVTFAFDYKQGLQDKTII